MLIIYRIDTGKVVDNTGTNSAAPTGPPDDVAFVNTDRREIPRRILDTVRLDDADDADLVERILTHQHHVDPATGEVVLDAPYPTPVKEPEPASIEDRLAVLAAAAGIDDLEARARARAEQRAARR